MKENYKSFIILGYIMFADVLKRLRTNAGLNQEELGKKLGLAKSTISMYENGTRFPNMETLEAIADYFNVDMNTLTDSKNTQPTIDTSSIQYAAYQELDGESDEVVKDVINFIKFRKSQEKNNE